ncbi:MAG TPA: CHRD domain-containing protein [Anaerolineales bacterium]|nr:CHRD domain-containing protein [Anaerolineales bacterium]
MKKATLAILPVLAALLFVAGALAAGPSNYRAHLTGDQEVPAVETDAVGQALFKFSADGTSLSYKLIVANIEDVVAAHIHCAPAGVNGGVGVTLFSGAPAGPVNGILAQATITAPDAANGCGWADLAAVAAAIESGDAYVNVHTLAVGSGEIRGQIK